MQWTSGLALWMVLTVAASLDLYDELPPDDVDGPKTIYQEDNSLATGPTVQVQQPDEASQQIPNWDATDLKLFDRSHSNDPLVVDVKNTIVKRLPDSFRRRANAEEEEESKPEPATTRQPKLKRKGKDGSQESCFFGLLCAFGAST